MTSSSMRKHLDYIYKRQLQTARRQDETASMVSNTIDETDRDVLL